MASVTVKYIAEMFHNYELLAVSNTNKTINWLIIV